MKAKTIFSFVLATLTISSRVNCDDSDQLNTFYGQEGTTFNDEKSCYRDCADQIPKVCYYKFKVEHYNTMGSRCDDCAKNVTSDCFKAECVVGNGRPRNVLTINRQIPGTTISVCWRDEIIVDVENAMSAAALTIHWHGQHMVRTPWMDGVPMVTQCPILPKSKFRYRFRAEQPGTHYYHAHTGLQRADGIFGRLIVRLPKADDPNGNLYDFDEDQHAIMLTDWTRNMAAEYEPGTTESRLKVDNVLINGLGCDTNQNQTNCNVMPLTTYYMQYNKTFRWRWDSNANQNCPLEFTIQGHNLTVIATDGYSVEPKTVDAVVSMSGERYDAVVHAIANRKIKEAFIRVRVLGDCATDKIQSFGRIIFVENQSKYERLISHARPYSNEPDYEKPFKQNAIYLNNPAIKCRSGKHLCVADLRQKGVGAPCGGNLRQVKPSREIPIRFSLIFNELEPSSFLAIGARSLLGQINKIVMARTQVPGLTQDDSFVPYCNESTVANATATEGLHFCPHLIQLELNEIVDFLIIDEAGRGTFGHPFHLHGHGFQVIDMGTRQEYESNSGPYSNDTYPPSVKDTISIPSGGYARVRFEAYNPGYWYFHCHLEWHMHVGMRAIVRVGQKSQMLSPPNGFPACGDYLPPIFPD